MSSVQPADAGIYTAVIHDGNEHVSSDAAILAPSIFTHEKIAGLATEVGSDILHPNGNTFDQILLEGAAAAFRANANEKQVTRLSFIDLNGDIVQVELSGPGTLSIVLDASTPPAVPENYHQPGISYVKGHAGIVIADANEMTNVAVFTVGRATAYDPTGGFNFLQPIGPANNPMDNGNSLFTGHEATSYDGIADIAFIAIASWTGRFGGVRTSNVNYFAAKGLTGIYAPGVTFEGPVYVGDISAFDDATPVLQLGSANDVRITGGELSQENERAVKVGGIDQLKFTAGGDSHGRELPARVNRAVLIDGDEDVTSQIVVNPLW